MLGYLMLGQCFGSVIVSQLRKALRRNSSIHSGSFFFSTIKRIVSSVRPRGITSDSISVTKPYLYSCLANSSAVLIVISTRDCRATSFLEFGATLHRRLLQCPAIAHA